MTGASRIRVLAGGILLSFVPCVWGQEHGTAGAVPHPLLARQIEFMERARRDATLGGAASAIETGRRYLALAEDRLKAGEPWASDLHQEAALAFFRAGAKAEAIHAYERLERTAQTPMWRSYAAYRIGELTDGAEAIEPLTRCRASIREFGIERDARLWIRATIRLADAHRSAGDLDEAIATRSELWDEPWRERLDPEQAALVCVNNARDCFARGETDIGRAWFDAFSESHPDFGANDGRAVLFRLERALAGRSFSEIRDAGTLREIEAVWSDPAIQHLPEAMVAASNLVSVHEVLRHDAEAEHVTRSARALFARHERGWATLDDPSRAEMAIDAYTQITLSLAQQLIHRAQWQEASEILGDFIARFPRSEDRPLADELKEIAQRGKLGLATTRRPLAADVDQDGDIDDSDFIAFLMAFGAGSRSADITGDGVLDARDAALFHPRRVSSQR